ncbi:MAG: hypothetical protein JNL66_06750 [Alphaproteobacteria bacterium]|nr:hypothetical protein [Alphaproteobacteria bacterium]
MSGPGAGTPDAEDDREIDVREAIIEMVIASLRRWEGLAVTRESLRADASHRAAFVRVLRECRPLPIVKAIEADALANAL